MRPVHKTLWESFWNDMNGINPNRLILIVCALALVAMAAVACFAFERLPHLEDEVAYLFQAKTMALGRLTASSPAQPEAFWTSFALDHQGKQSGKYAPGWPGVLATGVLAGKPTTCTKGCYGRHPQNHETLGKRMRCLSQTPSPCTGDDGLKGCWGTT